MPGRLREKIETWRGFAKSTFVLSVIQDGYRLQWETNPPPPCNKSNAKSCWEGDNEDFVSEAVRKLVENGAIQECQRGQSTGTRSAGSSSSSR